MKALIYKFQVGNKTYFAEGFNEEDVILLLKSKLNTSEIGKPFNPKPWELKRIWDKNDNEYYLTISCKDFPNIDKIKKQQHALHELRLLLKEDHKFLSGINNDVAHKLRIKFNENADFKYPETLKGWVFPIAFLDSNNKLDSNKKTIDQAYRFPTLKSAYDHVRNQLIESGMSDVLSENKEFTYLEMCDSFWCGLGNKTKHYFN